MNSDDDVSQKTGSTYGMAEFDIVDSVARENAEYVDGPALAYGDEVVYILEPRDGDD